MENEETVIRADIVLKVLEILNEEAQSIIEREDFPETISPMEFLLACVGMGRIPINQAVPLQEEGQFFRELQRAYELLMEDADRLDALEGE